MIPLERDRGRVHPNFVDPTRTEFELDLLVGRRNSLKNNEKQKFQSTRWKASKEQLLRETHGKCAYCEAPTAQVAFGDVEHYRPKSVYWWLAYCYDNYLASCQLCNQKFKKAKFPTQNAKIRSPVVVRSNSTDATLRSKAGTLSPDPLDASEVSEFENAHRSERPFILNPYVDEPADSYAWVCDDVAKEVRLSPRTAAKRPFVEAAESDLGLNRPQLLGARYQQFVIYRTFRISADDPGISAPTRQAIEKALDGLRADDSPYAGMVRFFDTVAVDDLGELPS